MKETKLKNFDQDFLKQLIKFLEDTYPDTVEKMYFRNVPIILETPLDSYKKEINLLLEIKKN